MSRHCCPTVPVQPLYNSVTSTKIKESACSTASMALKEVDSITDLQAPTSCPMEQGEGCGLQPECCGTRTQPGRPVHITHPNVAPESRPDCFTKGIKGYGRPYQNPRYKTTSADYGYYVPPKAIAEADRFGRSSKFSKSTMVGGNYIDNHLTTRVQP